MFSLLLRISSPSLYCPCSTYSVSVFAAYRDIVYFSVLLSVRAGPCYEFSCFPTYCSGLTCSVLFSAFVSGGNFHVFIGAMWCFWHVCSSDWPLPFSAVSAFVYGPTIFAPPFCIVFAGLVGHWHRRPISAYVCLFGMAFITFCSRSQCSFCSIFFPECGAYEHNIVSGVCDFGLFRAICIIRPFILLMSIMWLF